MGVHGPPWMSMDVHGWMSMDLHGLPFQPRRSQQKGKPVWDFVKPVSAHHPKPVSLKPVFIKTGFYSNRFSYPSPGKPVRLPISGSVCGHRDRTSNRTSNEHLSDIYPIPQRTSTEHVSIEHPTTIGRTSIENPSDFDFDTQLTPN